MRQVRCGWAISMLAISCAASPPPLLPATQTGSSDTMIVQRGPGELQFALFLSPVPRHIGDTMWVKVAVQNVGSGPATIRITPCYLTLSGARTQPWPPDRDVCAVASGEEVLPPGQSWTLSEGHQLVGQPGRYRLEVKIAEVPGVWLGTTLELERASRHR